MIRVILLQLPLVRLEAVRIVGPDHALEMARRVRQNVRARVIYGQVWRYGILCQRLVVQRCTGVAEGEEAAICVGCVVRVVLVMSTDLFDLSLTTAFPLGNPLIPLSENECTHRSRLEITPDPVTSLHPHRARTRPQPEQLGAFAARKELFQYPRASWVLCLSAITSCSFSMNTAHQFNRIPHLARQERRHCLGNAQD